LQQQQLLRQPTNINCTAHLHAIRRLYAIKQHDDQHHHGLSLMN